MAKETKYLQVATTTEIKDEVSKIAAEERRSIAEQGALIFEIGLQEYRKREEQRKAVLDGLTQVSMPNTPEEREAMLERSGLR
jgi:hypothetical protein